MASGGANYPRRHKGYKLKLFLIFAIMAVLTKFEH